MLEEDGVFQNGKFWFLDGRQEELTTMAEALVIGRKFPTDERELRRPVQKVHENLTHCDTKDLLRV